MFQKVTDNFHQLLGFQFSFKLSTLFTVCYDEYLSSILALQIDLSLIRMITFVMHTNC